MVAVVVSVVQINIGLGLGCYSQATLDEIDEKKKCLRHSGDGGGEVLPVGVNVALRATEAAAKEGAQIIVLPELFSGLYFCKDQHERHLSRAHEVDGHPWLCKFQNLAKMYKVVIPVSFYELAGQARFNSVIV